MAISTYAELQTAVGNFLHRSDLADRAPEFIALAEAQMNRRLRVSAMVTRATAAVSDEFSTVPSDFLGALAFDLQTAPITRLAFVAPDDATYWKAQCAPTGRPARYSIVGGEFQFIPAPDLEYTAELTYYASIPALSDLNTSNWVLANHPDAYLYGALTQAAPYLRDDDRLQTWGTLFTTALADIEASDQRTAYAAPKARLRAF
jgi:hypothetical protein